MIAVVTSQLSEESAHCLACINGRLADMVRFIQTAESVLVEAA
jgi:hypothetical protein